MSIVKKYIQENKDFNLDMLSYLVNLDSISRVDKNVAALIVKELESQRTHLKLIASENYSSLAVQCAMGNLLTDKYSEGFPYHRFYAGCENVDEIEDECCKKANKLFGSDHAYVQPHSGSDANLCAYWAILSQKRMIPAIKEGNLSTITKKEFDFVRKQSANQKLLALDYYSGGHLTHGYRQNVSAQIFDVYTYSVNKKTMLLDYNEIEEKIKKVKPFIFLAGFSAYVGKINYKILRDLAHKYGAIFMVDMAHFAGLVAGKVYQGEFNPVEYADVVTTTTHKTLRGPRGGMVLCKEEYAQSVDKGCPLVIGGPLQHVIAAKSIAFSQALSDDFKEYAHQIVKNSKALAKYLGEEGVDVLTKNTENHMLLVDLASFKLSGRQAESALRDCGLTLNRNALPFDKLGAWYTSGLRLGTPALTSLGMKEEEMREVATLIKEVLLNTKAKKIKSTGEDSLAKYEIDKEIKEKSLKKVFNLLNRFQLYPELDLDYLKKLF